MELILSKIHRHGNVPGKQNTSRGQHNINTNIPNVRSQHEPSVQSSFPEEKVDDFELCGTCKKSLVSGKFTRLYSRTTNTAVSITQPHPIFKILILHIRETTEFWFSYENRTRGLQVRSRCNLSSSFKFTLISPHICHTPRPILTKVTPPIAISRSALSPLQCSGSRG